MIMNYHDYDLRLYFLSWLDPWSCSWWQILITLFLHWLDFSISKCGIKSCHTGLPTRMRLWDNCMKFIQTFFSQSYSLLVKTVSFFKIKSSSKKFKVLVLHIVILKSHPVWVTLEFFFFSLNSSCVGNPGIFLLFFEFILCG